MDPWEILDRYFEDHRYPFTKHHLDSFREFLRTYIPNTVRSYNPIVMMKEDAAGNEILRVQIFIGGKEGKRIFIERPTILDEEGKAMLLTPQDARLRNMTYASHLFADIVVEYFKDGAATAISREFPMTYIGSVPLMLHSESCVLHGQGSRVLQGFGECPMDPGGYFIIDGKEKVIVSQERITTNRLFISKSEEPNFSYKGMIRCTGSSGETALSPRTVEMYLIRNPDPSMEPNIKEEYQKSKGAILVSIPSVRGLFPLTTLFRALGIESDRQIVELICGPIEKAHPAFLDFLRPSLVHGAESKIYTMTAALEYLSARTTYESVSHVRTILAVDLFPNIAESLDMKAMYLGYLVQQLMKTSLGMMQPSDRDSYAFKRVDISGFLLAQLFQETYDIFRKHVRDQIDKEYYYGPWKNTGHVEDMVRVENMARMFPGTMLTDIFATSLKGRWGSDKNDPDQGKVQDLARISYIGFLSHLRRVNLPLDRSIKVTSPHRLHSQQWGIMCPFESPDGASIGYLKNFALMTQITFGTSEKNIIHCFEDLGVIPLSQIPPSQHMDGEVIRVFLNGLYYGITTNPQLVVRAIRVFRRTGMINPFVSVTWNIVENEIRVQTEAGRPCRPLLIVENSEILLKKVATNKPSTSWFSWVFGTLLPTEELSNDTYYLDTYKSPFDMLDYQGRPLPDIIKDLERKQGCIEYLDIEEENTMYIAMKEGDVTGFHTHLEIHPSTAFSVVTHIVPFANHNQAPRVYFHAAQSKQAIGIYTTNFSKRFDTMGYIQHYPQKRIVTTRGSFYNGNNSMPNGTNVIVAVATHTGFNMEDSIILNKSSVDRGLFHITAYKTMTASEKTLNNNERIVFANPIKMRNEGKYITGNKHANYTLLGDDGIIKEESYVPRGQEAVVLGMVHVRDKLKEVKNGVFTEQVKEEMYHDVSLRTDVHHYGKVDRVFVATQNQGTPSKIAKVRFRKVRRPELGDKSCSSHGQKGVFGMILPQHDMPYTKEGIVPDLIINPHAFPSRMTIGHLVETVTAKLCCLQGCHGDGTVFLPFDTEKVYNELEENGYERHGNEILYNGRTGQQIETEIFMGPIFYYRLKHMVSDKVHARGDGPRTQLTHQPTSGRSKKGGLRVGEMERDVLLAHGLAQFTKEHMMEKSDKYRWAVCRHCGVIAKYNPKSFMECMSCEGTDISIIETPYAFKLLVQEMEAMGVQMRLGHTAPVWDDEDEESSSESSDDEMLGGELQNAMEENMSEEDMEQPEEMQGDASDSDTDNMSESGQGNTEDMSGSEDMNGSEDMSGSDDVNRSESMNRSEGMSINGNEGMSINGSEGMSINGSESMNHSEYMSGSDDIGMDDMGPIEDTTDMQIPGTPQDMPMQNPEGSNPDEKRDVKVIFIGDKLTQRDPANNGGGSFIEDDITEMLPNVGEATDKYSDMMGALRVPTPSGINIMESKINPMDPMDQEFWELPM